MIRSDVMTIKELRTACGMTIKALSEYLHIPYRTLQDWEREKRTPPDYIIELIEYRLRNEGLI